MEIKTNQNLPDYKDLVFNVLEENNISIERKAEFFLYAILELSEKYIILRNKREIEKKELAGIKSQTHKKNLERETKEKYRLFSEKLIENSTKGEELTTDELYLTLSDLCPIFPFCSRKKRRRK